jgi:hypothetical protein
MRSYSAQDIIALPTLNTAAAVALGQGLLTVAKAQTSLPALVATRLTALEAMHRALHQALSQKPQTAADPQRARAADLAEDQAWSALHDWLVGWTKLAVPAADHARTIYAVLFPMRLKFTHLPYKSEWAEADAKLSRITRDAFDTEIEKLGGKPILQQLRATHQAYGQALGITVEGQYPNTVSLREPLQAFTQALRGYVLAVAAHADPADAASIALTDALLSPLQKWQSHVAVPAPEPEPEPEPTTLNVITPAVPVGTPNNGQNPAGTVH